MSPKALSLLIAMALESVSAASIGGPARAPRAGRLDYDLVFREPVSTSAAPDIPRHPGSRRPPKMRSQRSRHQIWFKGRMLRIDMTSQPAGAPPARAASVSVGYLRSDGKPSKMIVSDGYSLIHNAQGTFLYRRGSGYADKLTSRAEPFLDRRNGTLPSLPIIDRSLLSRWRPGKVGSEPVGHYFADIYETDDVERQSKARRRYFRIWVSHELPVPVKFHSKDGDVEREEVLKTVQLHVAVPDSVFQLPAGTKIRESHAEED